jgi:hypothetical protein
MIDLGLMLIQRYRLAQTDPLFHKQVPQLLLRKAAGVILIFRLTIHMRYLACYHCDYMELQSLHALSVHSLKC